MLKSPTSHLCLGFLFCLLTAHLLRHSSGTDTISDGVFRDQESTFPHLLCWSKPHSPANRKGLMLISILWQGCDPLKEKAVSGKKKKKRVLLLLDLNCGWEDWDIGWFWKCSCRSNQIVKLGVPFQE